ncbi:MAG: zinc-binding dehydrogenase [Alphaproteobacteria bacterium]|nr:zinc-binding dehydrogenase [Alphaproteobacteria bacterium]
MARTTRRIVLAAPATGLPTPATFRLEEAALPALQDGAALVRTIYCSVDPGVRSRLSGGASYAAPLRVGETIDGFCVGEVIESASARVAVGDRVALGGGWAEHVVFPGRGYIQKIPHDRLPLSTWIGALGVPGMTAWFGLKRVAALKEGERVLTTSAAGPVGATAGQIAKAMGASRVVGVASGPEKAAWLRDAGFDAVIDYQTTDDLAGALKAASPDGYDVLFDNVGNAMIDSALPLMRMGGRIVISGQVADYNTPPEARPGLRNTAHFIAQRLRMEGLVVFDDLRGFAAAQEELGALIEAGAVKTREVRVRGLEAAPQAFIDLFADHAAFGRRIVEVGPEQ